MAAPHGGRAGEIVGCYACFSAFPSKDTCTPEPAMMLIRMRLTMSCMLFMAAESLQLTPTARTATVRTAAPQMIVVGVPQAVFGVGLIAASIRQILQKEKEAETFAGMVRCLGLRVGRGQLLTR
jgi:hypothetical protein